MRHGVVFAFEGFGHAHETLGGSRVHPELGLDPRQERAVRQALLHPVQITAELAISCSLSNLLVTNRIDVHARL